MKTVVDYMEEWFTKGACDGFCVMPPYIPGAHDDFSNLVIPELQRRGLFRTEYERYCSARATSYSRRQRAPMRERRTV